MSESSTAPKVGRVLRAPGFGLLTISTGADEAEKLLKKHFARTKASQWTERFNTLWAKGARDEAPWIIGIPSDSGGGICRGAAHGPVHLRGALYASRASGKRWKSHDLGDIPCIPQLVNDEMLNERQLKLSGQALWGENYAPGYPVSPLSLLEDFLGEAWRLRPEFRPFVLGGDHSVSGPIFKALKRSHLARGLAVLHVDAHTDLLRSRFGVEQCFGTWTSHALTDFWNPAAWIQIGIRASGYAKDHWEKEFGLRQYWSRDLRRRDPDAFAEEALEHWRSIGANKLYVTTDIDGVDAGFVPSTGTPEAKGLDPRWLSRVLKRVTRELPLVGADLVEVAPVLGSKADARKTVTTAARLAESLDWSVR